MNRFNGHFESKFHGCMILGRFSDEGRKRTVTVYAVPHHDEVIGLYDGVDTWVSPSNNPYLSKSIREKLGEIRNGAVMEIEYGQTRMRENDAPGVMGTPSLLSLHEPRARRRAHITPPPAIRERRRASIQR